LEQEIIYAPIVVLYDGHLKVGTNTASKYESSTNDARG